MVLLFLSGSAALAQLIPTYVVNIPMRDGKFLAADVYVPATCNSGCPTILIQTPYNKNMFNNGLPLGFGLNLQSSPYTWVVVDWRGFYGSAAAAIPQPQRGQDGYDVIEWIIQQSWSNGAIGTWGPSALGVIQYQTARENHPNHVCAVPLVAHPQQDYQGYFYGGVLEKSRLQTLDMLGYGLSATILGNPYYSTTWQFAENNSWYPSAINLPTLQIGGWYDHNIDKMMDWYQAVRTSATPAVRDKQWLLVGPWVHGGTGAAYVGSAIQGQLSYPQAAFKSDTMALAFFAHHLLNSNNGWNNTPKVTYYRLGDSGWGTSNAASIAIASTSQLYLEAGGNLQVATGTGSTAFTSDPRNPSPTIGGQTLSQQLNQGPYDQTALDTRSDVRTFSTGPLFADIAVRGRVKLDLRISCTRPDADIAVRLVDEYPDGRSMLINDGIRRLRFRNGYTQAAESFMSPGEVYTVEVGLPFVDYTWKAGHALKVYISGNSSTRWDVNLQNGGTMYAAGDTNTAVITIHHSAQYPSRAILPTNSTITSIPDVLEAPQGHLFPNPAKDMVFLPDGPFRSVIIRNSTGQVVRELRLDGLTAEIPLSGMAPGMYLLQAEGPLGVVQHRFVKE
jgi:uncharacterized protein